MIVTSISKVVERKVAVIKTLENKTIDICENEEHYNNISRFPEFLMKNFSTNTDQKVQSNFEKASANVCFPKLEICLPSKLEVLEFAGEPTKWQTFIDSY